jgi:hypothetical protein
MPSWTATPLVVLCLLLSTLQAAPKSVPTADARWESGVPVHPRGRIDELVFARLAARGLAPAGECSDSVFIRRVYLDTIGCLPTAAETERFLSDRAPGRRAALVEDLLARPAFADHWAMRWADLLRVKAEYPVNLWPNAAQAYHRWILEAMRSAMPLDRFARTLLVSSGSNFREGPVNFYRAAQDRDPRTLARLAVLAFLGERAEKWPAARLDGVAALFAQVGYKSTGEWKEEIVFWDASKARPVELLFPDGSVASVAAGVDPRSAFADWLLVGPGAPAFRRCMANRAWAWLLGRGLVEEPDDLRADNPPSNPELLEYLADYLGQEHCDFRALLRLILNSETYQLSCLPPHRAAPEDFACYPLRRLDAELLIDAINSITGTHSQYFSAIPEPYTFVPEDLRAVQLPDGSISSAFLEQFGRPPRDTGLLSERSARLGPLQQLHLLNSSHILGKLRGPGLTELLREAAKRPGEAVDHFYLTILSRHPNADERRLATAHLRQAGLPAREAALDLAWALINSDEFLFKH